jgi:hypothetical protein
MLDNWVATSDQPHSPHRPFSDVATPTYQNFSGPTYMNVVVKPEQRDSMDSGQHSAPHYVNVDTQSRRSRQSSGSSDDDSPQGINYVELDLDRNSDSGAEHAPSNPGSQRGANAADQQQQQHHHNGQQAQHAASENGAVTPGAQGPPRSYATIDFEKTAALSTFTSAVADDGNPATRKTRHDSMCPVPRSSISND